MDNRLIQRNPFATEEDHELPAFDGTRNNRQNPQWGSTETPLLDIAPLDYGDGFSTPAGSDRPNPRTISNTLSVQEGDIDDPRGLTNLTWAWGQFLDHDLSFTPELSAEDAAAEGRLISIPVPTGDPQLDPQGTGQVEIEMRDFEIVPGTGTDPSNPRQLPNAITAWIDGSNVYGSSEERANFLRRFEGGQLKTSEGELLPFNDGSVENDNPIGLPPTSLFVAGDVRANENAVLTSMHVVFAREHNRLAEDLAAAHPDWTDEQIFQRARQINVAQIQSIVYNEYLPALLGNALPEYEGYDPSVNPAIARTFSSAAFRLGHTQLSSEIPRLDETGNTIAQGNLTLADVFFPGGGVLQEAGIAPILRGMVSSSSQQIDTKVIEDVRSLLFGFGPEASARDLPAINIQRGRHNGLADYNTVRQAFGLPAVSSFAEITSDPDRQAKLAQLYGTVDNIDAFVGLLSEDPRPGASVGPTVTAIVGDQFQRLRQGDRFYYENRFTPEEIEAIEDTTLADILRRNTDIETIQDNAFTLFNAGDWRDDILNGGLGKDTMVGGSGSDRLSASAGDDRLLGNAGNDMLLGDTGNDILFGGTDDDELFGNQGEDVLCGDLGNDTIYGGRDSDIVCGNEGADAVNGDLGDDLVYGGGGDDTLTGGEGSDLLGGDRGNDVLTGGSGGDAFVVGDTQLPFSEVGRDEITDWADEDAIVLSGATFSGLTRGILASFATVNASAAAEFSEAAIVYDRSEGGIYFNPNGAEAGFGGGGQFLQIDPGASLSADNITVV